MSRALWVVTVALLVSAATSTTWAQQAPPQGVEVTHVEGGEQSITLNLNGADIQAFISAVSELTGKNFVIDPRVKGQVTVVSAAPTTPSALYDVFLSVLKVHGFAAVPSGEVIKIVPDVGARHEGTSEVIKGTPRRTENLVTAVIPTRHVNAAELVPILRPLLPQEAHLAAATSSNALVIADAAANVDRITRIVRQIDRDSTEEIEVVPLEHAHAPTLLQTLQTLTTASGEGAQGPRRISLTADERTNVILVGGSTAARIRVRRLIEQLDVPGSGDSDLIEVIYLKYASAADLVTILQAVGDHADQVRDTLGPAAQPRRRNRNRQSPVVVAPRGQDAGFQVQADEATNALIVQADPQTMLSIKQVVAQLDIRRAQVLVEGIVAEVSTTKADELGVQWKTNLPGTGAVAGTLFPGTNSGGIDSPFIGTDGPSFLRGLTLGYLSSGDLRALIRALSGDQLTNVLSTPTLMTLDNAEAEIVVGQNVPFITGQFSNNSTTPDNPFQTIERQDVGIVLRVKPQINEGNTVTLEIEQEVSSVDRDTSGVDLITNKRAITTTVLVDDRQVIVLGGLIEDDIRENQQKVPLLGDIPVIGMLFKNTSADFTKTNLMVFLRPTIIRDRATNYALTRHHYENIRETQIEQEQKEHFFLREAGPVLPSFDGLVE